jgi:hypothetical protein
VTGGQVTEVAKCDRWPGYRGGQLYSFDCTYYPGSINMKDSLILIQRVLNTTSSMGFV